VNEYPEFNVVLVHLSILTCYFSIFGLGQHKREQEPQCLRVHQAAWGQQGLFWLDFF